MNRNHSEVGEKTAKALEKLSSGFRVNRAADGASRAIVRIARAIDTVSTRRAEIGAWQNRLERTVQNLDNTAENMQFSEGRIRDTDMAHEMANLTKMSILTQATQAMMSQANMNAQSVLRLIS